MVIAYCHVNWELPESWAIRTGSSLINAVILIRENEDAEPLAPGGDILHVLAPLLRLSGTVTGHRPLNEALHMQTNMEQEDLDVTSDKSVSKGVWSDPNR